MKKKSFYLFTMMMAVVLCVGFTSCGSDDDDGPELGSASGLVGTWQWIKVETHYSEGNVDIRDFEDDDETTYFHFNADGTGAIYIYNYWQEYWSKDLLKYQLDGKKLTLIDKWGYESMNEIVSLSKSELKLRGVDDDDDSYYSTLTLRKVSDSVIAGAEE